MNNDILSFLQQNFFLAGLCVVSGVLLLVTTFRKDPLALSVAQATLKINREDALVLDVRNTNEWSTGRIAGAKHIPLEQLGKRMEELTKYKDKPVIVVCASGMRSGSVVKDLLKAGFAQAFNLDGGIIAWKDANLPVTKK